ncbi:thiamine pyrophosphate protein central region [Nitrospirillum viridazoti Y2]|uniref:Acetolactate synthase-1/2/3 large subunit n=1 Tax=Nitrospirillum amazonense TaxID=28077 RepID=A0A560HJ88_9PROT|nr:thiamine pyrophosphate-binding protein [Nitrospirillum amazonense]EGY01593.1 thiamine pyrophosphate protein central region [Nitrospirillum amazonense Y2]TWB46547.1 acetolactate synthase-1/2/3 large subunit [Nitrospirillum amazonense]
MTGAEYIAAFLASKDVRHVFLMTGGAATFMIDAIGNRDDIDYICMQHEQAAAMAADAVWRTDGTLGVAMATSGPGATNLLTGIACSYFDSIPALHITGQVNLRESAMLGGASPRQIGFQETKIVEMARPITKYAVQVRTGEELREELEKAYRIAMSGRMGPVLIDVPMDLQQAEVGHFSPALTPEPAATDPAAVAAAAAAINQALAEVRRPLIYWGAGVGLAGVAPEVERWVRATGVPMVSSWNGATYFDHDIPGFCGTVGVYGNRGGNFLVQNCDFLLVLGSRLDNRQRTGNTRNFAPSARVVVLDVDVEELAKYQADGYVTVPLDFRDLPAVLDHVRLPRPSNAWLNHVALMRERYFGKHAGRTAITGAQSPYAAIQRINRLVDHDAIIANDTGAALCWFFQTFHRTGQTIFTAGGNSPMGYSLPAAIAAKLTAPDRQVICFSGDGGFQLNLQELQTAVHYELDITIVILNNGGYGIIKQFQDAYMQGRYHATGAGYSQPDFGKIAYAYGLDYHRIERPDQITPEMFTHKGLRILDVILEERTTIEPKAEMGRPINDQFPYLDEAELAEGNAFIDYKRH